MTALQDQWHQQRQQRQQELAQRQQQVRQTLAAFQQERQLKAAQLRDDLGLFQLELQHETHQFLVRINQQRQVEAEYLAYLLSDFTQALRSQTAQFLAATAADRLVKAQQIAQDLSRFRSQLNTSVASLRDALQTRVRSLQAETQALLSASHCYRVQMRKQQARELTTFVIALHTEVEDYLVELELLRQERAQQLQDELQQSHDRRLVDVQLLFQQLAEFRAELRQYRAELSKLVWSNSASQPVSVEPKPAPAIAPATAPKQPTLQPLVLATAVPATPGADAPTEILERAIPLVEINQEAQQLEKTIYNYIHQTQGARLIEIESALKINRFQTVDALRALIKKGFITQRDRVYLIQEEVSL